MLVTAGYSEVVSSRDHFQQSVAGWHGVRRWSGAISDCPAAGAPPPPAAPAPPAPCIDAPPRPKGNRDSEPPQYCRRRRDDPMLQQTRRLMAQDKHSSICMYPRPSCSAHNCVGAPGHPPKRVGLIFKQPSVVEDTCFIQRLCFLN
ncbi:hypothetical protein JYU34_002895 [Plutella xylostella]|uniref:Uncharacterized protein n=1 Tax=Plutella xylostella TaxID=51655 RepID=A0ABQ7R3C6_PLUXY|nr:hypothetical protein JYU34_002895 [Plutella xylostella]